MESNKNKYNSLQENLLWVTVIIINVLACYKGNIFTIILIFWIIQNLFSGNIRRSFLKADSNLIIALRRSLYVLPLLFPRALHFKFFIQPINLNIFIWAIIGIFVGLIFIIPKIKTWQIYLSYDMISLFEKRKKFDYISMSVLLIITPICEEYFYRNFIIVNTKDLIGEAAIVFSAYLFFIHHFKTKWSKEFSLYDFIIQFMFGIVCGGIFYYSESIIPCIFAHLTYNSMSIALELKCYVYHYITSKNIEN